MMLGTLREFAHNLSPFGWVEGAARTSAVRLLAHTVFVSDIELLELA